MPDADVIEEFKNLVANPADVEPWIEYLHNKHEVHLSEVNALKAEAMRLSKNPDNADLLDDIDNRLMNIYDSRAEIIYQEFRKRFGLDKLAPIVQAKLDEIHYELTKIEYK